MNVTAGDFELLKDEELVSQAKEGERRALEILLKRYQAFIYNVAWKMVVSPQDAEDVMQEVIIKVITNLSRFEGRSAFRTWIYRITINHMLSMKKQNLEQRVSDFSDHQQALANIPDRAMTAAEELEMSEYVEEVKIRCMSAVLLCLNREQRLVYIVGDLLKLNHNMGAELFDISRDNFRQRLARARKDLYSYLNRQCGLINKNNPCRCSKKTKHMVENGQVDKNSLQFNIKTRKKFYEIAQERYSEAFGRIEEEYDKLYGHHPYNEELDIKVIHEILKDVEIRQLFNLN
ncbi:MAG: RNA polymerase sigma factor [Bacteroidota bacterium]